KSLQTWLLDPHRVDAWNEQDRAARTASGPVHLYRDIAHARGHAGARFLRHRVGAGIGHLADAAARVRHSREQARRSRIRTREPRECGPERQEDEEDDAEASHTGTHGSGP